MSTETSRQQVVAPVRREVRVACDAGTAFALFTAHLGAWWPLASHSVFGEQGSVAFEDGVVVERRGSDSAVWGTVQRWDPPTGFAMTWHPGQGPERATEVAVEFSPDGDHTLVTLTHTGWERLAEPQPVRDEYEKGWPVVLAGYEGRLGDGQSGDGQPGDEQSVGDGQLVSDQQSAEDEPQDRWYALHHRPGPALAAGGSVFEHPLFREHVAFLNRLGERGWLVAAGPVDAANGAGMAVVRIPAHAGAELDELAHTDDRSVTGGVLTVRVEPWDVRFTGAD